ncbi:unnamed protein product [Meloidogyne enterolobii]|uniref:Uncharacterized protein n=1 Tax=Meloidogyne enterolobii TaxID=390850 RepID=A0ACB0Z857_MELEN
MTAFLFRGKQMLGDPHLGIQAQSLVQEQPLLPRSTKNHLCDRDMHDWLNKTLIQEKDDWYKHVLPETDNDKHYYTQLPSILFGMVEDTVALSKEISQDIIPRVIDIAVDEFAIFSGKYKDAAMAYKGKHFEDRSLFQHYTATIIAIANNLDICLDSTDKLEKNIRLTMESNGSGGALSPTEQLGELNGNGSLTTRSTAGGFSVVNRQELIDKMEQLKKKFDVGIQFTISALLEEVLEDIIKHLEQIMTRSWLMGSNDLETICITIADYFNDYKHLRGHIRSMLMRELLFKLVAEFMIGIDVRRLTFNKYEERHLAMPAIVNILPAIGEMLDLRDKTLLGLEASSLVRKYPDIPVEYLTSLIQIREDIGRAEAKNIAEEAVNNARYHPKGDQDAQKLFQMSKPGLTSKTGRALPALESTMHNMFATIITTTKGGIQGNNK